MIYVNNEEKHFPVVTRCTNCNNAKTLRDFHISNYKSLKCNKCGSDNPIIYLPYTWGDQLNLDFLLQYLPEKEFDVQEYDGNEDDYYNYVQYVEDKKCSMCNHNKFMSISFDGPMVKTHFGELPTGTPFQDYVHRYYSGVCSNCGDFEDDEHERLIGDERIEWENDMARFDSIPEEKPEEIDYDEDYDDKQAWDLEHGGPDIEDGEYK
jgi:hypothetical protein